MADISHLPSVRTGNHSSPDLSQKVNELEGPIFSTAGKGRQFAGLKTPETNVFADSAGPQVFRNRDHSPISLPADALLLPIGHAVYPGLDPVSFPRDSAPVCRSLIDEEDALASAPDPESRPGNVKDASPDAAGGANSRVLSTMATIPERNNKNPFRHRPDTIDIHFLGSGTNIQKTTLGVKKIFSF
jgi:hypothetical protein